MEVLMGNIIYIHGKNMEVLMEGKNESPCEGMGQIINIHAHILHVRYIYLQNWVILFGHMLVNIPW